MAYLSIYSFVYNSQNGSEVEIRIQKDAPLVIMKRRHLGGAPVLRMQNNGPIWGTSLDFPAECLIDGEFAELYTSDPKKYQVVVLRRGVEIWRGFIVPELYSEPDVAPPYDVQITATDGLGDLKLYDYVPQGAVTLRAQLQYILGLTGLSTSINLVSSLQATLPVSVSARYLLDRPALNLDYMAGKNCYEVLNYILDSLHAVLFWRLGSWWLIRETDIAVTNSTLTYINPNGSTAIDREVVHTVGQLGVADMWPVGYGTTTVNPAKKEVLIQAPWHLGTPLKNAKMTSTANWTVDYNNGTEFDYVNKCFYCNPTGFATPGVKVSQTIENIQLLTGLKASCTVSTKANASKAAYVIMQFRLITSTKTYFLTHNTAGEIYWQENGGVNESLAVSAFSDDGSDTDTIEMTIPPLVVNGLALSGNLECSFMGGTTLRLYSADLQANYGTGFQTRVKISNGARGSADTVEICGGRSTLSTNGLKPFLQGIFVYNNTATASWKTARLTTNNDFLTTMAQDYAISIAAPRLIYQATLNSPIMLTLVGVPIILQKADIDYIVRSYEWNLFEDEIRVEAISLPSVDLTVESQTIEFL